VPAGLPEVLSLFPNRPNPFSPETTIAFRMAERGRVMLKVYSVSGRLVRDLIDEEVSAGIHDVSWDGCDETGRRAAAGVYFYQLSAPGIEESRRMILLR
jgi:flagellar hook assembly protein FlgD